MYIFYAVNYQTKAHVIVQYSVCCCYGSPLIGINYTLQNFYSFTLDFIAMPLFPHILLKVSPIRFKEISPYVSRRDCYIIFS